MIPDIIHYCWFSGEEMPPLLRDCMASWRRHMPECEIRLWDMEAVRHIDNRFMREALDLRMWAFATDYVRLYAVERYGGIYMDTDVMLYGSLKPYMADRMFIGRECVAFDGRRPLMTLTSHLFGAEPHHPFLKACLRHYEGRPFVLSADTTLPKSLRFDQTIVPFIQALIAESVAGYDARAGAPQTQHLADGLTVYPEKLFVGGRGAVANHFVCGSWREHALGSHVVSVPLWRRAIGALHLHDTFERLLRRMGYWAVRL